MSQELQALIEMARGVTMNPEEREAQRISFAFGNAGLENADITRADVVRASEVLRATQDEPAESTERPSS